MGQKIPPNGAVAMKDVGQSQGVHLFKAVHIKEGHQYVHTCPTLLTAPALVILNH